VFALVQGLVDFAGVGTAAWFAAPAFTMPTVSWTAAIVIAPVALVTIAEHIGHLMVTENIVGRNLMKDPGLHRSMLGDGVATGIAALLGGPPSTTYGENIGVMAITRVYSVWVIGGAAVFAILFSFIGKFSAIISSIPVPVMGGISLLLFGIIASAGLRMLVESGINYNHKRNLIISSVILVLGVGGAKIHIGDLQIEGMALATFAGILLNLVLPRGLNEEPVEVKSRSVLH
jgi:uracil permease